MHPAIAETKATVRFREFVVGIHREGGKLLVRKSEIIAGIRVPLDETYVLDVNGAIITQDAWVKKLHVFPLN